MNPAEIDNLVHNKKFSHECESPDVIETHISWVFLCEEYAYKIKKPVKFDEIDFSTLNKREFYCKQELELNRRFAPEVYLEVVPVTKLSGEFTVEADGHIEEYALKMKKIPQHYRMDRMLEAHEVKVEQIQSLAERLADFHANATISKTDDQLLLKEDFIEIVQRLSTIHSGLKDDLGQALVQVYKLIDHHSDVFRKRIDEGYNRDCNGDLHAQNIFLSDSPVIFDCLEFSERLRQIDVLSDIAFLCMDMEYHGHKGLGDEFFDYYNHIFPIAGSTEDFDLHQLYKAYRAGVRARVKGIIASSNAENSEEARVASEKYAEMMIDYINALNG